MDKKFWLDFGLSLLNDVGTEDDILTGSAASAQGEYRKERSFLIRATLLLLAICVIAVLVNIFLL